MTVRFNFDDDAGGTGAASGGAANAGRSLFEPLLVELFVERDVVRAARYKDEPVLARGLMSGLAQVETETLGYRQAVNLLDEAGKLASAAEALKAKAVARVCATAGDRVDEEDYLPPAGPDADQLAAMAAESEIRTVLDVSRTAVDRLVLHSSLLTTGLPATLSALTRGDLNPDQAGVIVDQCGTLPPEAFAGFEQEMVAFAPGRAKHLVARKARRVRERAHPETIRVRKQKAAADRMVVLEPVEDGMAWLSMYLPAEAATAAYNRLTSLAKSVQGPDEARTRPELMADIAADLLHTGTGTGAPPAALSGSSNDAFYGKNPPAGVRAGAVGTGDAGPPGGSGRIPNYAGIRAEIFVVVPVLTLMGLSDEPADLEGYGPVDEDTARQLAAHAPSFKRLLTHPETGALLSYGRNQYGVPKDLKKMVQLRDRTCTEVGCNRAARSCEMDHTRPFPIGETALENLKALCKPGHALKTAKLWRDVQHRDGSVDWISPAGREYTTTPDGPLSGMRPVPEITHLIEKAKGMAIAEEPEGAGAAASGRKVDHEDPYEPPPF